jgi:hypothetical protein
MKNSLPIHLYILIMPLFALFITGCGPSYFPGIVGTQVPGILRPPSGGNAHDAKAEYFSVDGGNLRPFNDGESNRAFRGHVIWVRHGTYHTVNYGLFAYGGTYTVEAVQKYRGEYTYFGPGFEFSGEIHQPLGRIDLGIGLSTAEALEFGDFYAFRKQSYREGFVENSAGRFALMMSVFPLIRYRASDRTTVAFQGAVGLPGLISPTVTIHHDDFAIWMCWTPRYLDEPEGKNSIFTIGIGHRVP